MIDSATAVRQELVTGELKELQMEAEELANDFKTRQYEMSVRHEKLAKGLRKAE